MTPIRRPSLALCAALLVAPLLALPSCKERAPEPEAPAETTPAPEQATPESEAAEPQPDPVAVIEQGGDQLIEGEPLDTPAASGDDETPANPLSALPGISPSAPPVPDADAPEPPAPGVLPTDAPVSIQVTAVDLSAGDAASLEPLRAFLATDDADALDADEVAALFELLDALEDEGVAEVLAQPRVIIAAGEKAAIRVTDVGPGALPGVRQELLLQLAPAIDEPQGEGPDALQLVRVGYDFRFNQAETALQVVTQDLGLDIGPRARVAGTGVVQSGQTFYVVRRVVGGDTDRELLLLIRPTGMKVELNK